MAQLRHIFYPKLTPEFDENYQIIKQFVLEVFHHDEYAMLEKSGLFSCINKIIWSKEKVINVIFNANKNRIKEINIPQKNQSKFQCQGPNNMLIDIIINHNNIIISAYPSMDNFPGVLQ